MKREDIHHLLGGYAAGTLTPAEQQTLFAAALEDQHLFNALADEQSLKELLDDPEARGYLRAALEEAAPIASVATKKAWWPAAAAISAVAACLAVVMMVTIHRTAITAPAPQTAATPSEMATNKSAEAPGVALDAAVLKDDKPKPARTFTPPVAQPVAKASVRKEMEPAAPPPPIVTAAVVADKAKKSEEVDALANAVKTPSPAPPPPAQVAAAEDAKGIERKDTSAAPAVGASARGAFATTMQTGLSASQLYLKEYRQNFAPGGSGGGPSPDSGIAEKRNPQQQQQQREQEQRRVPEDQAIQKRRAPAAMSGNVTAAPPMNRGIRYQILRKNSQSQYVQTRLDTRFEAGDEIVIQVEKNAPGLIGILSGNRALSMATQSEVQAATGPIRLTTGTLEVSIVFSDTSVLAQTSPSPRQITEQSGNLMYVVLPGAPANPVVAQLRLVVH